MNYQEIGQIIRAKRKQLGLTQESLAEAAGVSVVYISQIECTQEMQVSRA